MSPFHAAEIMALLTFLIGCASFHRVLGRTSSRSVSSYMPPAPERPSRASRRTATPVPERASQPVAKSSRSPNAAFRVVCLRGQLTLVPESQIPLKKAA
jgi:hypothetical protein